MTTAIATRQPQPKLGFVGSLKSSASARPSYLRPVPAPENVGARSLDNLGTTLVYARGKTVVEEGDPADSVYKVVSGALRTVRLLADGRRSVISFLLPGDFFGFAEAGHFAHTLEVLADASLVRFSKQQMQTLIERDPREGHRLFNIMCQQLSQAQDRLLTLGRKSALERMASFLIAMAERGEEKGKAAGTIALPMNRADIADYMGLTVETVSRLLTQLRAKGIIDLPAVNRVVVNDRARLEALSENES